MANSSPNSATRINKAISQATDLNFMDVALSLARRGLGNVHPNPAVGCIIAQGNEVVGRGWTGPGGRPHAETVALKQAGASAKNATAYVTLEPCAHHGQTPPCVDALIAAKIKRCVISMEDPDERVSGQGIAALQNAGIEVTVGVRESQAKFLNRGFLTRITKGRPHFTLKTATSLDGKIATAEGQSKWITGTAARAQGHALRARHDAILTAMGTITADNPELTCRLPGLKNRSPIRIILDPGQNVSREAFLIETADQHPIWVITAKDSGPPPGHLISNNIKLLQCDTDYNGRIKLTNLAQILGQEGLTRILVEGGSQLSASFIKNNLVDELIWFRAPFVIGGDGLPAVAGVSLAQLIEAKRFRLIDSRKLGDDMMETYVKEDD